jgi:hypothetical protein
VTATGSDTTILGAGRPAASAAATIVGAVWFLMVPVPVIQVMVPSATVPASFNMAGPKAATSTGGAETPGTSIGAKAFVLTRSPLLLTVSLRKSGMRDARYSFI